VSKTVEEKAALWDALMSCERIRIIGHAKLGDPKLQHMGVEFWANHPAPSSQRAIDLFHEFVEAMLPKEE